MKPMSLVDAYPMVINYSAEFSMHTFLAPHVCTPCSISYNFYSLLKGNTFWNANDFSEPAPHWNFRFLSSVGGMETLLTELLG